MDEFQFIISKIKNNRLHLKDLKSFERELILETPAVLKNVCCLCLSHSDEVPNFSAAKQFVEELPYYEIVAMLLHLDIRAHPEEEESMICEMCSKSLGEFSQFKDKCEKNHKALSQLKVYVEVLSAKTRPASPDERIIKEEHIDSTIEDVAEEPSLDETLAKQECVEEEQISMEMAVEAVEEEAEAEEDLVVTDDIFANVEPEEISVDQDHGENDMDVPTEEELPPSEDVEEPPIVEQQQSDEISVLEYADEDDALEDGEVEYLDIAWQDLIPQLPAEEVNRESTESVCSTSQRKKRSICPICGHAVDGQKKLERHLKTHIDGYKGKRVRVQKSDQSAVPKEPQKKYKKYTCPVCEHDIDTPSKLKVHMAKHMQLKKLTPEDFQPDSPIHVCTLCHCQFPSAEHLSIHEAQHEKLIVPSTKKTHLCAECGNHFPSRSLYITHMVIHTGEKPFKCEVCDARFTRKAQIAIHMRTHLNIKPYSCDICGQKFSKSSNMYNHMVIHSNERNFACGVCGKTFKRRTDVPKHMVSHTGERNYSCKICRKSYASRSGLLKHNKRHPEH